MESEDIVVSMTPPTSPHLPATLHHSSGRHSNSSAATTSTLREKSATLSVTSVKESGSTSTSSARTAGSQDAPIDLSMKSTSSGGSSAKDALSNHDRDLGSDEDGPASDEEELSVDKRRSSVDSIDRPSSRNNERNALENATGLLIRGTTPLDLTTKI